MLHCVVKIHQTTNLYICIYIKTQMGFHLWFSHTTPKWTPSPIHSALSPSLSLTGAETQIGSDRRQCQRVAPASSLSAAKHASKHICKQLTGATFPSRSPSSWEVWKGGTLRLTLMCPACHLTSMLDVSSPATAAQLCRPWHETRRKAVTSNLEEAEEEEE